MAYDKVLNERVRAALADQDQFDEKKMFGGVAFMLNRHMCCGIIGNELMVRVGPAYYREALAHPHAREMDVTGRPMTGMVLVAPQGIATDHELAAWVQRGVDFVATLPPK